MKCDNNAAGTRERAPLLQPGGHRGHRSSSSRDEFTALRRLKRRREDDARATRRLFVMFIRIPTGSPPCRGGDRQTGGEEVDPRCYGGPRNEGPSCIDGEGFKTLATAARSRLKPPPPPVRVQCRNITDSGVRGNMTDMALG